MFDSAALEKLSRRRMLAGMGSVALLGASGLPLVLAQSSQGPPSDAESHNKGGPPNEPDPKNPPLTAENPDSFSPPAADSGDVDVFKYSFALGHNKVSKGGWARQVTVRDLPVSKDIAGVNMRLETGAIRELHWHAAAEWAFMIYGKARITGVDSQGRAFVDDVGKGDLWNFPSGIPHSIQGLPPDGCEFLLVFDDGHFSEFDTFLITDWMAHTPPEVLAKNFSLPQSDFEPIPKKELYIFPAPVPASLAEDQKTAVGPQGMVPSPFSFRLMQQKPDNQNKSGEVRIVDSGKFKQSTTIASAHVILHPGGLRELHWHPNADEWQYYIKGKGRMGIFIGGGKARTMDFEKGDVGYLLKSVPHWIENTGDEDLEFLEMFKSDFYEDLSLGEWISHLPPELVQAHLRMDPKAIASVPKQKLVVVPT